MSEHASSATDQVSLVRDAVIRLAAQDPCRWWTADELRRLVQNGFPATIVSVAISELLDREQLILDKRLRVRCAQ